MIIFLAIIATILFFVQLYFVGRIFTNVDCEDISDFVEMLGVGFVVEFCVIGSIVLAFYGFYLLFQYLF